MLLDIALDGYLRLRVERMEKSSMSGDDLLEVATLVLRNHLVTAPSAEFQQARPPGCRVETQSLLENGETAVRGQPGPSMSGGALLEVAALVLHNHPVTAPSADFQQARPLPQMCGVEAQGLHQRGE